MICSYAVLPDKVTRFTKKSKKKKHQLLNFVDFIQNSESNNLCVLSTVIFSQLKHSRSFCTISKINSLEKLSLFKFP